MKPDVLIRKYMSNNKDDIVTMIFTTQYLLYRLILAIFLTEKEKSLILSNSWEEANVVSISQNSLLLPRNCGAEKVFRRPNKFRTNQKEEKDSVQNPDHIGSSNSYWFRIDLSRLKSSTK